MGDNKEDSNEGRVDDSTEIGEDTEALTETVTPQQSQSSTKKSENHSKEKSSKPFGERMSDKLNEYKGEFRKIIWPSRKELFKKTTTVIITSLAFGVVIFCIDSVFNVAIQEFVQHVAK